MVVVMKGRGVAVHEVHGEQLLEVVVHVAIFFRSSVVGGEEVSLDPDG